MSDAPAPEKTDAKIGGRRAGSGRKPGVPNRVTRSIKAAIHAAFNTLQRDPKVKLTAWARANPNEFYRLVARLIPQEVKSEIEFKNVDVTNFTDEELAMIAAGNATNELITRLVASTRSASGSGARAPSTS